VLMRVCDGIVEVAEEGFSCASRSSAPTVRNSFRCSGRGPLINTVIPRRSNSVTMSPSAWAPVNIEHLQLWQPQDHHSHVAHRSDLGQEPLSGTEEQGAVESVGEDALRQQRSFGVGGHFAHTVASGGDRFGHRGRRARDRTRCQDRRNRHTDFHRGSDRRSPSLPQ